MKVAIIAFSPTGNTLKVTEMLEKHLLEKNVDVQVIDITGEEEIFKNENYLEYLNKQIKEHDILCIGSPVYAQHLHFNVKNIIKNLPKPDSKWGELAFIFVTFGGASSGVALLEGSKLLQKSGRTPLLAMKINAEHSFTKIKQVKTEVNKGLPGKEEELIVEELANKIASFELEKVKRSNSLDITYTLNYLPFKDKLKAYFIFREKIWHRFLYPKVSIDLDQCKKCGKCAEICPVLHIEMTDKGPIIPKNSPLCVHCMSCVVNCPADAIKTNSNWKLYDNLLSKVNEGKGFIFSKEEPKSAIFE